MLNNMYSGKTGIKGIIRTIAGYYWIVSRKFGIEVFKRVCLLDTAKKIHIACRFSTIIRGGYENDHMSIYIE